MHTSNQLYHRPFLLPLWFPSFFSNVLLTLASILLTLPHSDSPPPPPLLCLSFFFFVVFNFFPHQPGPCLTPAPPFTPPPYLTFILYDHAPPTQPVIRSSLLPSRLHAPPAAELTPSSSSLSIPVGGIMSIQEDRPAPTKLAINNSNNLYSRHSTFIANSSYSTSPTTTSALLPSSGSSSSSTFSPSAQPDHLPISSSPSMTAVVFPSRDPTPKISPLERSTAMYVPAASEGWNVIETSDRNAKVFAPSPRRLQSRDMSASPPPSQAHGRHRSNSNASGNSSNNGIYVSSLPPRPPTFSSSSIPQATTSSSATSHLHSQGASSSRRTSASSSFSSSLMAKPKPGSFDNSSSHFQSHPHPYTHTSSSASSPDNGDDVMDIESCIDNPILAPLGRHVNKRRIHRRADKGHIDINVVPPTSTSTFIQEQERESHAPVTSLILRRRRLDCAQLDSYLQNLQPTLDPQTMSILQSPLLHLTELDLSRNRLEMLPDQITSLVPHLNYLNLSHNLFTEIPLELCQLTELQVLIMSQNRIQGPVPDKICSHLTQLKTLKLCANQITSLPDSLAHLNKLESLSMGSVYGGNLLTAFPAGCIRFMPSLRELDLSHNKLRFLPVDIGHPHSHLRQLVASDNKLEVIPKSIGLCRELRSLNLGRNQLTSLPTEIADLKQLDTLDLSENLLCVIPGDVADFLTKTTLLLTGNPFTRGYCDANRNPVSEIGGLGINYPSDEERYSAVLKSLSRRAILNSAASSSSSHTSTLAHPGGARESPRLAPTNCTDTEHGYEMDQDERLDYHLYYTRHTLSSRPPSRAESISSLNEGGAAGSDYGGSHGGSWMDPYGSGTGTSTPRVNVEAVVSDIDSFFDYIPSSLANNTNTTVTTAISSSSLTAEPSIFDSTLSEPSSASSQPPLFAPVMTLGSPSSPDTAEGSTQSQDYAVTVPQCHSDTPQGARPVASSAPIFFPTLKELAARAVLHGGKPLPLDFIPEPIVDYLQPGARPCAWCRRPYVKEWVSSVRVKSYLGHPAVARRVRFCSVACWKTASVQLEAEEASGLTALVTSPGATTGHLPPVVTVHCAGSDNQDDELPPNLLDSSFSSPTSLDTSMSRLDAMMQGMKVCKGGQTYWPVIARERRSPSPPPIQHTVDSTGSIAPTTEISKRDTSVCSGRCLGGSVCEW